MKKTVTYIWIAILLAVLFFAGYIYAGSMYIPPHFHANFALYIDDERFDFSDDAYMEDVAGCSLTGKMYPEDRVHLHENNPDTIHVHAEWVSWGHFFANNNIVFGENFIKLDSWEVKNWAMSFILNGEEVRNPFNDLIKSEDRMLIAYNSSDAETLYETVSDNAPEYNEKYDPGSCGGTNENATLAILRDFVHSLHTPSHHE